jgi:hypothetical protein
METGDDGYSAIRDFTTTWLRRVLVADTLMRVLGAVLSSIYSDRGGAYFWTFLVFTPAILVGYLGLRRARRRLLLAYAVASIAANMLSAVGLALSVTVYRLKECSAPRGGGVRDDAFCDGSGATNFAVRVVCYGLNIIIHSVATRFATQAVIEVGEGIKRK